MQDETKPRDGAICLVPDCRGAVECRGLCAKCYREARRLIDTNATTEAELIEQGLILESRPGRRPKNTALADALASRQQDVAGGTPA